jgi:hypothetical protein
MLLSFAIIAYILSVVLALVFLFSGKNLRAGWFRIVASFHFLVAVLFIFNFITSDKYGSEETPKYFSFLLFICTGVVSCGLAFGVRAVLPFRIYFSVFGLSLVLFLVSPSTLFRFLITARLTNSEEQPLLVNNNIYLEKQNSSFNNDSCVLYKLVEKHGMFHQSIARNLDFKGSLDSIKIISFQSHKTVAIRGYTSKKTYVSAEKDSVDLNLDLNPKKKDIIERSL